MRLKREVQDWEMFLSDAVENDKLPKVMGDQVAQRLWHAYLDIDTLIKLTKELNND